MNPLPYLYALAFAVVLTVVWLVSGRMKRLGRLGAGDARKVNHVFALAGGALWFGWLPDDQARLGGRVACGLIVVLVAVVCRLRHRWPFSDAFLANTRASDAPHEAFHFWFSWSISMFALLAIDLVLADVAVTRAAALLVGIGDGVGEPIGIRFGRHRYSVPGVLSSRPCTRSVEGSLAVVIGCFVTVVCCFAPAKAAGLPLLLTSAAVVALAIGVVEAVSPHGLDNLTIPLSSAVLLRGLTFAEWL